MEFMKKAKGFFNCRKVIATGLMVALALTVTSMPVDAAKKAKTTGKEVEKKINERAGVYKHSLTKKGTRILAGEINVVVTQDTFIKLSEAKSLTMKDILVKGNVSAGHSLTGGEGSYIWTDSDNPAGLNKLADAVTFSAADMQKIKSMTKPGHLEIEGSYYCEEVKNIVADPNYSFKINLNFVDEGVTAYNPDMSDTAAVAIHANNFAMDIAKTKDFKTSDAKSIPEIEFKAWDTAVSFGDDFPGGALDPGKNLASIVQVDQNSVDNAKKAEQTGISGAYDVKYSAKYYNDETQEKVAKLYATNKNTAQDKDTKNAILFATDFTMDLAKAKTATEADVKTGGHIKAYDYRLGTQLDDAKVEVNITKLATAKHGDKVVLPVKYNDGARTLETTVTVVVGDGFVPGDEYTISALKNVPLTLAEAKAINGNADLIKAAQVKVYKINNVTEEGTARVKNSNFQPVKGVYDVTFAANQDPKAEITSKFIVGLIPVGDYFINANDLDIGIDEAKTITNAQIITKSDAYAYKNTDFTTKLPVEVKSGRVVNIPVVGGNPEDNAITLCVSESRADATDINVKVWGGDIVIPTENYLLVANHFEVNVSEANNLNDAQILAKSKAKVYWKADGSLRGTAQVVSDNVEGKVGVYKATLNVKEEPTNRGDIEITVVDNTPPTLTSKEQVTYDVNVTTSVTEAQFLKDIDAKSDGVKIDSTFNPALISKNKIGHHKVTLTATAANGATTTKVVAVNIMDGSRGQQGDNSIIMAEGFTIKTSVELTALTQANSKDSTRGNVKAWDLETGEDLSNTVTVDPGQYKKLKGTRAPGKFQLGFLLIYPKNGKTDNLRAQVEVVVELQKK